MDTLTSADDAAPSLEETHGGITPPTGWRYVPGLDGIRALAVIVVLAFHAGMGWFGGGLLGVDLFFVLSGFLITSLLVSEFRSSGTIRFTTFYARRARRLLPALVVTMLMVAAFALLVADPGSRANIRGDAFATMGYVANWRYVLTGQNYFVFFGAPSPLLHTWSLAVEEQFYLVWPALALFVLRRRGTNALFVTAVLLAVASAIEGYVLLHTGASTTRMYYGTDLRVQEVMVGAALAAWWGGTQGTAHKPHRSVEPSELTHVKRAFAALGVVGLLGLLWAIHTVNGQSDFLYGGGFFLVALLGVSVIASVVKAPRGPVGRVLSLRPVRYVGQISYGLYLYHFPIFLAFNAKSHLEGNALLAAKFATTFVVAAASARFIEQPVRRGLLVTTRQARVVVPAVTLALIGILVVCTLPSIGAEAAFPEHVTPAMIKRLPPPNGPLPASEQTSTVMFGDSMALLVATGLQVDSRSWGVTISNEARIGCDLLPPTLIQFAGGTPSPSPTGCLGWQKSWPTIIAKQRPDVVTIAVGRWEVIDRLIDGHWRTIASPVLQQQILTALDQAITISSAKGAKVVLFTLPYVKGVVTQSNGEPLDLNQHWRTDLYNHLVRVAAARHPGVATVIDENKMLDPNGQFVDYLGGIRVRDTDEEHPSVAGGMYLRPQILPILHLLGTQAAHDRAAARSRPAGRSNR